MSEVKNFTCIRCPIGCALEVKIDVDGIVVTGNTCKRGEQYAVAEVTAPTRTVTATAALTGGEIARAPVKTAQPIPKQKIFEVIAEINKTTLTAPVKIGDVAVKDAAGTGVDVIVTRNIDREVK